MKCEKCNHDAVRIKKNHFCPSCGKKVDNKENLLNVPPAPKYSIASTDISKNLEVVDTKKTNIINLKENKKNFVLPQAVPNSREEIAKSDPKKEEIDSYPPNHIKSIIEKHTEPRSGSTSIGKKNVDSVPILSSKKDVTKNITSLDANSLNKTESQIRSPENIFASKKKESFWGKPVEKKSMIPTKKETTLKKMLILVVALNVLVILGIVYLLLT